MRDHRKTWKACKKKKIINKKKKIINRSPEREDKKNRLRNCEPVRNGNAKNMPGIRTGQETKIYYDMAASRIQEV